MTVFADGTIVGPYTIVRRIAAGGMGAVYQARHTALRRDAALKVLLPHLLGDYEMIRRLDREARAIASLRHSHIVEIYDADITNEPYYLAMEYHQRGSLEQQMAELRELRDELVANFREQMVLRHRLMEIGRVRELIL